MWPGSSIRRRPAPTAIYPPFSDGLRQSVPDRRCMVQTEAMLSLSWPSHRRSMPRMSSAGTSSIARTIAPSHRIPAFQNVSSSINQLFHQNPRQTASNSVKQLVKPQSSDPRLNDRAVDGGGHSWGSIVEYRTQRGWLRWWARSKYSPKEGEFLVRLHTAEGTVHVFDDRMSEGYRKFMKAKPRYFICECRTEAFQEFLVDLIRACQRSDGAILLLRILACTTTPLGCAFNQALLTGQRMLIER